MVSRVRFWEIAALVAPVAAFILPVLFVDRCNCFDIADPRNFWGMLGVLGAMSFPVAAWSWARGRLEIELAQLSRSWPTVTGTLQSLTVVDRPLFWLFPRYVLTIEYLYEVDDRRFDGDTFAYGPHLLIGRPELDRLAARYKDQSRAPVVVHYNPDDPAQAVLHTGDEFVAGRQLVTIGMIALPIVLALLATIAAAGR